MQLHNKLSPCFFSHSYRFICFFAILANNSSTYNLFVPKRIFKQGFRLLKKCIYASEEKHKALCEKHKAFISKYKAHILKYVPYIFRFFKCVINRGLYQCIFIHFLTVDKTLKNTVTRIRFALTPPFPQLRMATVRIYIPMSTKIDFCRVSTLCTELHLSLKDFHAVW